MAWGRISCMTTMPNGQPSDDPSDDLSGTTNLIDDELRQLVRQAFETAKESGRPDWQQMTTAVLKNRLLDLTGRTFDEKGYGARTISDLVRRLSDMLLIDDTVRPARVTLSTAGTPLPPTGLSTASRVRPDLWRAIIDFKSGRTYVWDGSAAVDGEQFEVEGVGRPKLPTITPETMERWRTEFSESVRPHVSNDADKIALDRWRSEGLPARDLPSALRGRWSSVLKDHVVSILKDWFVGASIRVPQDLLLTGRRDKPARNTEPSTEKVRDFVLRCISVMTDAELRDLRLPPAAVLRAQR